jgi:hypothetical protein
MLKRIHSNRDAKDTLYAEVRKEFRPYFEKAGTCLAAFINRSPRWVFGFMIGLLMVSAVLTFTVFRHPAPVKTPVAKIPVHPFNDGFSQIMRAGAQLKETIRLKKMVDSISAKKVLTVSDSTALYQALDSLRRIHPPLK